MPGWERFVRCLLDAEKVEVFMSGLLSALLSREIATAMRGCAWEVVLFHSEADYFSEVLMEPGVTRPARSQAKHNPTQFPAFPPLGG